MLQRLLVAVFAALQVVALTALALSTGAVLPTEARAGDALRNEFYRNLAKRDPGDTVPDRGKSTALLVTGAIGPGSYDRFYAALSRSNSALVVIEGPGGVLGEALLIGEEIRRRRIDTLVAANRRCASACAVVFLSGRTRYLGTGASVGLHSASYRDGRIDPEATQLMAAYLSQVGVPAPTLKRMAATAPSDIRWLTPEEQRAMGIKPYN